MADLGKAYIQIVPSAQGISGKISQALKGETDAAGKTTGANLGKAIGGTLIKGFAAMKIGDTIKQSIMAGADLQQNLGGTEAVFGKYASNIQKTAQSAYKNMGQSASDYMATANKMGSLFQGSGLSESKSLDLTTKAMQRAADVASVMGIDTSMAMESIAGAAKGNFTMMDNLGVAMNATTLEAYALEKGLNFKWNTATQAEKTELAMKMFFDRTSKYSGNFAKEAEGTISGSLGMLSASWQDLLGNMALGNDVYPQIEALGGSLVAVVKNVVPAVGNVITSIPRAIIEHAPEIGTAIQSMVTTGLAKLKSMDLAGIFEGFAKNAAPAIEAGLEDGIPKILSFVGNTLGEVGAYLVQNWPSIASSILTLMGSVLTGVLGGLGDFGTQIASGISTSISSAIGGMWTEVTSAFGAGISQTASQVASDWTAIQTAVSGKASQLSSAMSQAWSGVKTATSNAWSGMTSAVSTQMSSMQSAIATKVTAIKSVVNFNSLKSSVASTWNGIKTAMTKPFQTAYSTLSGIVGKIKRLLPIHVGKILSGIQLPKVDIGTTVKRVLGKSIKVPTFNIAWHAEGGIFDQPTLLHGVGEAGAEAVLPLDRFWQELEASQNREEELELLDSMLATLDKILKVNKEGKVIKLNRRELARTVRGMV